MKNSTKAVVFILMLIHSAPVNAESWRGLTIADENRCSVYDRKSDYPYSQSVEKK